MRTGTTAKLGRRQSFQDKSESVPQSPPQSNVMNGSQTKQTPLPQKISKKAKESAQLDLGQRIYRAMGSAIGNIKIGNVDPGSELKSQRKFHLSIEVNLDLTTGQFEFVEMAVEPVRKNAKTTPEKPPTKSKKAPQKFKLNPPKLSTSRSNTHNDEVADRTRDRIIAILASIEELPPQMVDRIELIQSRSVEMFGAKISNNTLYKSVYKPLWQKIDSVKSETDFPH
jgi:hypothetical protein